MASFFKKTYKITIDHKFIFYFSCLNRKNKSGSSGLNFPTYCAPGIIPYY